MMVTQKIKMHLDRAEANPRICAVRGDSFTRQVEITLYENDGAWALPEGLAVTVLYRKADGTEGAYDTLPDGTAAWSGSGNVLTVLLAPQMMTAAGPVLVQLEMSVGEAILHSFGFYLLVSDVAADMGASEDYFGWRKAFLPQITGAEEGQFIQIEEVDELGRVVRAKAGGTVPGYVRTAAEALARKVSSRAGENSFSFAVLADAHCGYYSDLEMEAVRQAAQAVQIINRRCGLDFIVHGGDMALGAWYSDRESTFEQMEDYAELMAASGADTPNIWCAGNHDDAPYRATEDRLSQGEVFGQIGRRNARPGAVCPQGCNYGYLDLENRKIRVIFLDTDDKRDWGTVAVGSGEDAPTYLNAHNIGGKQLAWLAGTALDFTKKEKPGE